MTSLGGKGKIKRGKNTMHGTSNPLRNTQKSGRNMDVEFDTPFDDKGRCHHHPTVQMATKKRGGGWKILVQACPRCIEARYDEDSVCSSRSGRSGSRSGRDNDEQSVGSRGSKRSVSRKPAKAAKEGAKFDKMGE